MYNKFIKRMKSERGATLVLMALLMTVILGFCGLVADIGNIVIERQKFQNALDSAALAGALELPDTGRAYSFATQYITRNGYEASDVEIYFSQNNSVLEVKGSKSINFLFARVLGFNNITVRPSAAATLRSIGGPFDYALFSGSKTRDMIINGSGTAITGSTHTNSNFILHGANSTITGACEAMKGITVTGSNVNIGERIPNSSFIEMPDFSETIKTQAQTCGVVYPANKVFDGKVTVNSSIYVNGEINVNSSEFSGTGCILAKNSIVFNGSSVYKAPGDSICFYSENGNIIFNGSNSVIHGVIYAPKGTVIFNGSNQTVYGRIIADNIIFNGQGLTVISQESDTKSIPAKGVKLIF